MTSFSTIAHHIPNNGSCLVVYGPHVGIDADGTIGKVKRLGRDTTGPCGSATAAGGYDKNKINNIPKSKDFDLDDDIEILQQKYTNDALMPYIERLEESKDPDAEFPVALFDCQDDLMNKIVSAGCKEVAGEGLIALLGGIQINTPPGIPDYFLPKKFELRTNTNFSKNLVDEILDENNFAAKAPQSIIKEVVTKPVNIVNLSEIVKSHYPGALSNADLACKVGKALGSKGYGEKTTLLATALCCDEVNRELEKEFRKLYLDSISMGGLAGYPFGGDARFKFMVNHIPTNGSCLIIYGPNIGIDEDGVVISERVTAVVENCKKINNGDITKEELPDDIEDDQLGLGLGQQKLLAEALLPYIDRLENTADPLVEIPHALFDCLDDSLREIVSNCCKEIADEGLIALLGGIQINTPEGEADYFLPKVFELRNNKNRKVKSLIYELK